MLNSVSTLYSLTAFTNGRPTCTCPTVTNGPFIFLTGSVKRPLVPTQRYIAGSTSVPSEPFFIVVAKTGVTKGDACLHAVKIGCMLTYANYPMYYSSLRVCPTGLIADLQASSSLASGRSCFFTRLGQLGRVVSHLGGKRRLFVVLSRVLGKAGSVSGRGNSFTLMHRLVRLGAGNVVTARSLLLKGLVRCFPGRVQGCYFRTSVAGSRLAFSCGLHRNVTRGVGTYFLVGGVKLVVGSWPRPAVCRVGILDGWDEPSRTRLVSWRGRS